MFVAPLSTLYFVPMAVGCGEVPKLVWAKITILYNNNPRALFLSGTFGPKRAALNITAAKRSAA